MKNTAGRIAAGVAVFGILTGVGVGTATAATPYPIPPNWGIGPSNVTYTPNIGYNVDCNGNGVQLGVTPGCPWNPYAP